MKERFALPAWGLIDTFFGSVSSTEIFVHELLHLRILNYGKVTGSSESLSNEPIEGSDRLKVRGSVSNARLMMHHMPGAMRREVERLLSLFTQPRRKRPSANFASRGLQEDPRDEERGGTSHKNRAGAGTLRPSV